MKVTILPILDLHSMIFSFNILYYNILYKVGCMLKLASPLLSSISTQGHQFNVSALVSGLKNTILPTECACMHGMCM